MKTRRKWYVFTANETFTFTGYDNPPRLEGETSRMETYYTPWWKVVFRKVCAIIRRGGNH
jgi:hypothetical protein